MSALVLAIALLLGATIIYMLGRMEYVDARMRAQYAMESLSDTIRYNMQTALEKGAEQQIELTQLIPQHRLVEMEEDGYAFELIQIEPGGERRVLLTSEQPVLGKNGLEMSIPSNRDVIWTLRIAPQGGWISSSVLALSVALLLLTALLMAGLSYLIAHHHRGNLRKGEAIDAATGLYTRAAGEKWMRNAISERAYKRMALVLLDVDDFTALNERCGTVACDKMLSDACFVLRQRVRGQDVVCRVMSDMVMVGLLFGEDASFLDGRLEELRKAFDGSMQAEDGETMQVHASAGVALLPENGSTFRELFEKADMALYWSKRDGKNQTTIYREPETGLAAI